MARLLNLLRGRRDRLEHDLARELRYHVDRRVEELTKSGLSAPDAERQARLELGGLIQVQENVRDAWVWRWVDVLARDVRYAARSLTTNRGFALGAGVVLALAIGANTAIFSLINTVLLRPLPYPAADRLFALETFWTNTGQVSPDVSGPDFLDWRAQNDVFESMAAYANDSDEAVLVGGRAVFANAAFVSEQFFGVFGQTASAGRLLTERDIPPDPPDGDAQPVVAVVAHDWAVTHFGTGAAAVGKTISVYGNPLAIVGVAARGFRYPNVTDIWAPWPTASDAGQRNYQDYHAVGRLKRGMSPARAQAQMRTIGDNLARRYPENRLKTVTATSLQERLTGNLQATLWVLMSAVGAVWLIACANIASLLLARAAGRTREIALRAALGAGRAHVVRQLLTESCLLAAAAGLAGVLLASVLLQGVVALSPATVPRLDEVRIDNTVLLFALGLSLLSTVLFGLAPALHASRLDLSDALKQGSSKATARTSTRLRSGLVVIEVALSVVLLTTAGLLLRSFQALRHVDLGFTTDRVLVAYTEYAVLNDADIRMRTRAYADVLDRLRAVPGVSAAAGVANLGFGREPKEAQDYFVEGRAAGEPGQRPQAEFHAVTRDYFKTLEIPVRAGRDFNAADTPARPLVAIVNETLARRAFPGESPIGRRIRNSSNPRAPWAEIVGVVGDTRWQDPSRPAPPMVYRAASQGIGNSLAILTRTSLDQAALSGTLRELMHDANTTVPVKFETMEEEFDGTLAYPRFRARVIGLFAGAAALLAAVGIFSVVACLVGHRMRELAVRRVLGARAADVMRLIVSQGLRLVGAGLVLGLAGALSVARLLTGLLYEIGPWDVGTYLGTIAVLGGAGLLATLVPAIRAATIAPAIVLQQE